MAASHAQSVRSPTHFDIDVVLAVFYHADVGVVDGLLVVLDAGRPVSSRTDHLESKRITPSALSHPGRHSVAAELFQRQRSPLAPFACQDLTKLGNTCSIHHLHCLCEREEGCSKPVLMLNNILAITHTQVPCPVAALSHLSSSRCNRSGAELPFLLQALQ